MVLSHSIVHELYHFQNVLLPTINSVYIRMFVFVCFHRRQIANSFEALRGSSECTLLKSADRFYAFYATFISCARAEHARVQFVPEGKTRAQFITGLCHRQPSNCCIALYLQIAFILFYFIVSRFIFGYKIYFNLINSSVNEQCLFSLYLSRIVNKSITNNETREDI